MPDYASLYEQRRELLLRRMLPQGTGVAVDIGCNDGRFTALLRQGGYSTVIGYDTDAAVLRKARVSYPDIDFRAGYDDFSFSDRSLTVALELIEHLPPGQQLDFLRSVRSATVTGGLLFLSTPGRYSLLATFERVVGWKRYRVEPYTWWDATHVSVVSYARLRRLLHAAGFAVERRAGYCFAPPSLLRPRASFGRLARAGFDIIVVAKAL